MFETSRKREYETMTMIIKSPYAFFVCTICMALFLVSLYPAELRTAMDGRVCLVGVAPDLPGPGTTPRRSISIAWG